MLKLACCCVVALTLLQVSCGERRPTSPDSAADGSSQPRDSGHGRDGSAPADQHTPMDTTVNPALYVALKVEQLYANCMPSVPPDPVSLKGHVELLNNGASAVGPLTFYGGALLTTAGAEVATFDVKPIGSFVIKPGEGLSAQIEKVAGSLKGAAACGLCGKALRVALAYSGAGIPAGSKVTSDKVTLSCAY